MALDSSGNVILDAKGKPTYESFKASDYDYYKSIIKNWGDKWENFEIDDETYNKNCPYGYEDWSCPYCSKWTINFYYN